MADPEDRRQQPRFRLVEKLPVRVPYLRAARATQLSLQRDVEIRILPGGTPEPMASLFFEELRELAGLDHPGFLQVLGDLSLNGRPCYLVPLRDHPTLAQLMADRDFTLEERCEAVRSLAGAVSAAHAADILLGPMLPARVAWDADSGVAYFLHHKLADEDWESPWLQHTPLLGRPEAYGKPDDVFAWGLLAFWLLTRGQQAYGAGPDNLRPLRGLERQVAESLSMVVEASLAWDPGLRPQGGPELQAVLRMDRSNIDTDGPPPRADLDMLRVSSEVLGRVDELRSSGQILVRKPTAAPSAGRGPDDALRADGSLLGDPAALEDWKPAAARHGLALQGDDAPAGPSGLRLLGLTTLAFLGIVLGAAFLGPSPSPEAPPEAAAPAAPRARAAPARTLARPGHQDVDVQELIAHDQDLLPEDFPGLFRKLQSLVMAEKLPEGENDGRRLMRLWILYKRRPERAAKQLQDWIARLRKKLGATRPAAPPAPPQAP